MFFSFSSLPNNHVKKFLKRENMKRLRGHDIISASWAGELPRWLRAGAALAEDTAWSPVPMQGSSQPPITPALGLHPTALLWHPWLPVLTCIYLPTISYIREVKSNKTERVWDEGWEGKWSWGTVLLERHLMPSRWDDRKSVVTHV